MTENKNCCIILCKQQLLNLDRFVTIVVYDAVARIMASSNLCICSGRARKVFLKQNVSVSGGEEELALFKTLLSAKKRYVRLLKKNGILLDSYCCIMVVPDFDAELLDALFANLHKFMDSRFHFRNGTFRRCAFVYSDARINHYIENVQGMEVISIFCTSEDIHLLVRTANFFYLDTRMKIISLSLPFCRRADRLLASGKISKAAIAEFGLPGKYRNTELASIRFLFLTGSLISFVKDLCIPFVSVLVRLLPWNVLEQIYWYTVIAHGRSMYHRVCNGRMLAICPYKGTGDVYLAMSLFLRYAKDRKISDFIVCVQGENCKNVASLFIRENVIPLNVYDMTCLTRYFFFKEFPESSAMMLHQSPPFFYHDVCDFLKNVNGLNFLDVYRYVLFNDSVPQLELPAFGNDGTFLESLFLSHGLSRGKTVLLAPYAYTLPEVPLSVWQHLALRLSSEGYDVVLNCCKTEKKLPGTVPLFIPYKFLVPFVERAGAVIAVRSGLCEVLSSAQCRKIVLYPKKARLGAGTSRDFFSLSAMGLCSDALELECDADEAALFDAIVKFLKKGNEK